MGILSLKKKRMQYVVRQLKTLTKCIISKWLK